MVLPFPVSQMSGIGICGELEETAQGEAVLRGIAWYCPVPGGARRGRYCAVLRGIALSWVVRPGRGGIGRYCVVLACPRRYPEGAVLGGIGRYWPLLAGFERRGFFLGWDFVNLCAVLFFGEVREGEKRLEGKRLES